MTNFSNNQGITLIELMVVLVLVVLLMSAAYLAYQAQHQTSIHQQHVSAIQMDLRAATDNLEFDIRLAGLDPTISGITPFTTIDSGDIQMQMDLDENGSIDSGETIRYYLNGTDLLRQVDADTPGLMAHNVTNLEFIYLNANGAVTTDPILVQTVTANLQLRTAQQESGSYKYRNLTRRVRLRN